MRKILNCLSCIHWHILKFTTECLQFHNNYLTQYLDILLVAKSHASFYVVAAKILGNKDSSQACWMKYWALASFFYLSFNFVCRAAGNLASWSRRSAYPFSTNSHKSYDWNKVFILILQNWKLSRLRMGINGWDEF